MRRLAAGFAFALAMMMPSPARADAPVARMAGKTNFPSGSVVFLDASASVSEPGLALRWVITPPTPTVLLSATTDTRPGVYVMLPSALDGKYRAKLIVRGKPDPAKADLDADADVFDFTVGAETPAPHVDPPHVDPPPIDIPPAPLPIPAPVAAGHLFATYIADASAVTSVEASMKRNPIIEVGIKPLDASFRWYESDESEIVTANLLSYATQTGLPCLIIQTPDGKIVAKEKNPTPDRVIQIVKGLRGSK
jgi:hypothetical protein